MRAYDEDAVEFAAEVVLDAMLSLADGKDDDELVFIDGFFRRLADELGIASDFAEVEPMTAGDLRGRWRAAKARLAHGGGPGGGRDS